jgi:hypothetical protein
MKKIFLNFVALFFITGAIYAQDFYFGYSPGEVSSVYSKMGNKNFKNRMYVFMLTGNFTFSVILKNNVELETGIMYYPYPYIVGAPTREDDDTFKPNVQYGLAYRAFSLPVHVGYKFKLANRFYANIYSGLNFDFYFDPYNSEYSPYKISEDGDWEPGLWSRFGDLTYCSESKLQKCFNVMFANRFSIQYFTKYNMGISLYASYYSGLRQVWESHLHYTYDSGQTFHKNTFLSRGSYWNFGIELGFKLTGNKEERKLASSSRKEQRKKILELLKD